MAELRDMAPSVKAVIPKGGPLSERPFSWLRQPIRPLERWADEDTESQKDEGGREGDGGHEPMRDRERAKPQALLSVRDIVRAVASDIAGRLYVEPSGQSSIRATLTVPDMAHADLGDNGSRKPPDFRLVRLRNRFGGFVRRPCHGRSEYEAAGESAEGFLLACAKHVRLRPELSALVNRAIDHRRLRSDRSREALLQAGQAWKLLLSAPD